MPEIVYVLTNEAMPGLVKIGLTNDSVETRLTHLSSHSGVPLAFECYFAAEVKDGARIEKTLHHAGIKGDGHVFYRKDHQNKRARPL